MAVSGLFLRRTEQATGYNPGMFTAAYPLLLWSLPLIAVLGLIALWRGRHVRQRVSSLLLWRGLDAQAAGRRARSVDPLWLLVFLAAFLAGVALPQLTFTTSRWRPRPTAEIQLALRQMQGRPAELFVRSLRDDQLPERVTVEVTAPGRTAQREVPVQELRAGYLWAGVPADDHVSVRVVTGRDGGGGGEVLGRFELERPRGRAFGLLTLGPVSPALRHVFEIQPGCRAGDATAGPLVVLVDDPHFDAASAAPSGGVVIASPRTPLPGVRFAPAAASATAPATTRAADQTPAVAAAHPLLELHGAPTPRQVSLADVRVFRHQRATLDPAWQVLATVEGDPWLAVRRDEPSGQTMVWLGSRLADTNWAGDVSFPVFFTNVVRAITAPRGEAVPSTTVNEWTVEADRTISPSTPRTVALTPWLTIGAVVLLGIVMALLVWRTRL